MEKDVSTIYAKDNLEFVTVAAKFCSFLENDNFSEQRSFIDTTLKLLPLLYLKMSVICPKYNGNDDGCYFLEECVTEQDYDFIHDKISNCLKEKDDYLDILDNTKYSDEPVLRHVSEDLADIYQDLRNFVWIFSQENEEATHEALHEVCSQFEIHWGLKLINSMRALHQISFDIAQDSYND